MLSKRQKAALNVIQQYIDERGISPTIREIRDRMGVKAVSTAYNYLLPLKKKGYIDWLQDSPRSIRILRKEA